MDLIYIYILNGDRGQDLIYSIFQSITPEQLISSLIFRNRLIYHDIRALLKINGVDTKFPDMRRNTPVATRLLRALWPDEYEILEKQLDENRKAFEQNKDYKR